MIFSRQVINKHEVCKVSFIDDQELLALAEKQAKAKAAHTNIHAPSARKRTFQEVYNAQLLGTLADLACSQLLQKYFEQYTPGTFAVIRYDDIRKNNYELPDQFDIQIVPIKACSSVLTEIEIRSSVCNRIPMDAMIRTWHILGWYVTDNKPGEKIRDFYMRPIYHYTKYASGPEYQLAQADKHLKDGSLDLYIVGGATSQILEEDGQLDRGYGLLQEGATYQIVQIIHALAMGAFLKSVLSFCQQKLNNPIAAE